MNLYRHPKNGRFYARFTQNGKRRMLSTGETDKTKALLKLGELLKKAETTTTTITLSTLSEKYLAYAETHKAVSTVIRDKRRLKILMKEFDKSTLISITQERVERYLQKRRKTVTPASCNRELALLKHMLNKAVDWNLLKTNPIRRVKQLKEPPGRLRYLTDNERQRLLKACKESDCELLHSIVLTALLTGMRKSELQELRWRDVDLTHSRITVIHSKNNNTRHIPIHADLLSELMKLRSRYPNTLYVFSKHTGQPYGDWYRSFRTACRRAGLTDFRFHDCRHDFCSRLGMNGCNVYIIMRLAGHKDIKMSARYTHISDTQLRDAVAGLVN
ncbi:tyrosine-type recombinase/integrase [candidate division WOR-3 bacterium]|nr:tyrosine-type recombinase/integrase [candidate division WOR-3 bacterium]